MVASSTISGRLGCVLAIRLCSGGISVLILREGWVCHFICFRKFLQLLKAQNEKLLLSPPLALLFYQIHLLLRTMKSAEYN